MDVRSAGPFPVRAALAVSSGLLMALAFPPWELGWLAGLALAPLVAALHGTTERAALGLGFLSGLAFYLAAIWWVIHTMTTFGGLPLPLSLLALLLLAAVLAAYPAAFAGLLQAGRIRLGLAPAWVPPAAAILWTALEVGRTYLFSGFPWLLLGTSQYRQPTLRLLASLCGVYGISALLAWVGAAAGEGGRLVLAGRGKGGRTRTALLLGLPAAALLAAAVGYGQLLWRDPAQGPALRVGLLQGNIDQAVKWERGYQTATLAIYEELARQAAAGGAELIVWPETAIPFFLRHDGDLGPRVTTFVAATGVPMLVGSPDLGPDRRFYNTAFLVGADGSLGGRYDKRHLVPFGEYVPLQPLLFFLERLVVGIGDFGRGAEASLLGTGPARFGVMICYEVIFPAEVREFAARGAAFLVNITNDAWFGETGAPAQHLAMAAMRAVETGSYLVRAANTGITAVIAPSGEIRAATRIFTRTALVAPIRLRQETTPYVRHGDLLAWGAVLATIGYLLALAWTTRRTARPDSRRAPKERT